MKRSFRMFRMLFSLLAIFPIGVNTAEASWVESFWVSLASPDLLSSMEIFILDESGTQVDFEPPGSSNFASDSSGTTVAGWTADIINPDYLLNQGTPVDTLYFDVFFSGDKTTQLFNLDFLFYNQTGALAWGARWDWDGAHWGHGPIPDGVTYDRAPVPEPATMLLLGSGLAGLGAFRIRRRKK